MLKLPPSCVLDCSRTHCTSVPLTLPSIAVAVPPAPATECSHAPVPTLTFPCTCAPARTHQAPSGTTRLPSTVPVTTPEHCVGADAPAPGATVAATAAAQS